MAWATLISQVLAALACIIYTKRKLPILGSHSMVFRWETFCQIMKYGIPNAIQISLTSFMGLSVQNLVNSLGTVSIAGITSASKVDSIVYMPITSLSNAASTMVAQNIGAGDEARTKQVLYKSLLIMILISLMMSLGVYIFRTNLIGIFFSGETADDVLVNMIGARNLSITAIFYSIFALFYAYSGFYRGVGAAWFTMFLSMSSLLVRMLSAYFMVNFWQMQAEAMAWSTVCGWMFSSGAALVYFATGKWRVEVQRSES